MSFDTFRDKFTKTYNKQINKKKTYHVIIYDLDSEYSDKEFYFQNLKNIEECCNSYYKEPWAKEFDKAYYQPSSYNLENSFAISIFNYNGSHKETRYYEN